MDGCPSFLLALKLGMDSVLIRRKHIDKPRSKKRKFGVDGSHEIFPDNISFSRKHYEYSALIVQSMYNAWNRFCTVHCLPSIDELFTYLIYYDVKTKSLTMVPGNRVLDGTHNRRMYVHKGKR